MPMVPILTGGCFAGVRPDESARMEWEMIDLDRKHIDLPATITKDGQRRLVDMSGKLLEWVFLCRRPSGKILPENFRRKRRALCHELERGMAGRHFETFLWLLRSREIPQRRPHCPSNGEQELSDALCALSRGREKLRCHRLLDDVSVRRWQSSQVRGVID
jgi:hypothetical protein